MAAELVEPKPGQSEHAESRPEGTRSSADNLARELAGLDALELTHDRSESWSKRSWKLAWPKALAILLVLAVWQGLVWAEWKPAWVFPGPAEVFSWLSDSITTSSFWAAIGVTMTRAVIGFLVAVVIGSAVGISVVRVKPLRAAIGSVITGLQTMPSVAWFPLAVLLFQLSEKAILFVVVLGAAPSIANGLINGVDYVPPLLKRVGANLGARGFATYRYVVLPAALPSFVAGLKQGWAFAWRSLMAGELLSVVAERQSIGTIFQSARDFTQPEVVIAMLIVVLVIGILVDSAFGVADRTIRRRWGIADNR
jgi:NitT/TauT family transport system permease protein